MPKQELTYEQVARACDKLKEQGITPSLTMVAEKLKLYTVTSALNDYLEQWFHNQPEFQRKKSGPLSENIMLDTKSAKIIERNEELEKSLSLLRATLESTADGIMMVNGHGQVVDWNQKFVDIWRIPSHLMEAGPEKLSFDYILEQLIDPKSLIADVQYLYQNPEWQGELPEIHFKDGRIFERFTQPQRIGRQIVGRVYSFRDVTQRRMADDQLRIRERAIEASSHGIAIVDVQKDTPTVIYVNRAFGRITGFAERVSLGKPIAYLLGDVENDLAFKRVALAIREGREERIELQSMSRHGEQYWCELSVSPVKDSFDEIKHFVCTINDITQRRDMEEQLVSQATHDYLTELPNRVLLMDRVEQAILQAKKKNTLLAFMFIDLDRFKLTNDTLGHTQGDKLLQAVANRLLMATDEFDTVARIGGDEFVIILPDIRHESVAMDKAEEFLKIFDRPFLIGKHSLKISASIGLSFYPKDGLDYETLMKNADLSMYYAKDNGRNAYRVFEPEMNRRVVNHMQLDSALRDALGRDEFYLVYQPLIDLKQQRVTGFEALLRWESHLLGRVAPMDFISMAEENGLIIEIGEFVLRSACEQLAKLHKEGFADLTVAVNISGRQFKQVNLSDNIQHILKATQVAPRCLELELTESLLVEDIDKVVETMHHLKDMGVSIVIDDFGTGYSSLSYLKRLPVDMLKIDRSFISEIGSNLNDAAITKAIIDLGHSLNIRVLAEGVETSAQRDFITENHCDFAQGYYFKPPMEAEELVDFIKTFNKERSSQDK